MSNSFRKSTQIGPVVLYLYGPLEQGISLNEGSITGVVNVEDFEGPLQGNHLYIYFKKLFKQMYMLMSIRNHKRGEIRGRVRKVKK